MACLNNVEIQQIVDGEGRTERQAHIADCARCATRVDERRHLMAGLTAAAVPDDVPSPMLEARVRAALRAPASARGATVLRPRGAAVRKPLWVSALAAAAAGMVVFLVLPRVGAPTSLSAAQIIDRSLVQMTRGTGVELLEYRLVLSSDYRRGPGLPEGPYRIVQLFDRSNPERFKFAAFDRDDVLVAATSQDPVQGRRTELQRIDGRNYVVHVTSPGAPIPSIPQLLQAQAEAVLRLMQINADQELTVVDNADGRHYVIELPESPAAPTGAPLVLNRARIDIDGRDFRVRDFSAAGVLLGLPFDVSFTLLTQVKAASVEPALWEIESGPDDVVIEGEGEGDFSDSTRIVLRELGRRLER